MLAAFIPFVLMLAAGHAGPAPIAVPQGNGAPVITDGIFSPGEWDDALRVPLTEGGEVTLHLKEYRGVVFVGVRGPVGPFLGASELSLAAPGGPLQKLHISYGLYEVVLPATGPEPRARVGYTDGWYANEFRQDEHEFARLKQEGKDFREIMAATMYPLDGVEFAIRRSKIPGKTWLMRVSVSAMIAGKPGMITHPPGAAERTTDGWLELRFKE